tara:strand:+ start:75 stop:1286 length:1212 start_codon:yes stop_codon:yes gene_type:complete
MARRTPTLAAPLRQLTLTDRVNALARRAEVVDPGRPALCLFGIVLALLGLGLLMQVSHAATTLPEDAFQAKLKDLVVFRMAGLFVLLVAARLGPQGIRRYVPALTVLALAMLLAVYLPGLRRSVNGSGRWVDIPLIPFHVQPSEFARVIGVLWVARRCAQLGDRVQEGRSGYLPLLAVGAAFAGLILFEPDFGGAMLFLLCYVVTMWTAGARPAHLATSAAAGVAGAALIGAVGTFAHVRERVAVWLGESTNEQVVHAAEAVASGDLFGVGVAQGASRQQGLQYMQTDYALSLVGEELGFAGVLLVVGLYLAFLWYGLQLVLSVKDRYVAVAAFGLLVSVAFQAMLHLQVVTQLAPPKGMNLPFLSDGGSALLAACLAVGLALGAARHNSNQRSSMPLGGELR